MFILLRIISAVGPSRSSTTVLETGDACMLAMSNNPLCAVGVAPLFTCPSYVSGLETEPEDI